MKKLIYILALLIPFSTLAQISDAKYQEVVLNTLELINDYESASSFANNRKTLQFENLFESNQSQIVNDIPMFSDYNSTISVSKYMSLITKNYNRLGVDVSVEEIVSVNSNDGNDGEVNVVIRKTIWGEVVSEKFSRPVEYSDGSKDNIGISYKDSFYELLTVKFSNNTYKISSVQLSREKGNLIVLTTALKKGLSTKSVFVDNILYNIKVDGNEELHEGGFFKSISDLNDNWSLEIDASGLNKDYLLTKKTYSPDDIKDNLVPVEFKLPIGSLNGVFKYNFNAATLNTQLPNSSLTNNSSTSYGASISLDLNALNILKKKPVIKIANDDLELSVYGHAALMLENYDYNINIPDYGISFSATDPDGMSYIRHVNFSNINESQTLSLTTFSGGLETRFVYKRIGLMLSASTGVMRSMTGSYTSSAESISYSGYYENLFGVTIYDDYHDFGTVNNVEGSGNLNLNQGIQFVTINAQAQLEMGASERIFFFTGLGYSNYQGNMFNPSNEYINTEYSDDGLNNDLQSINNLPINTSFKYLSVNAGIAYKL